MVAYLSRATADGGVEMRSRIVSGEGSAAASGAGSGASWSGSGGGGSGLHASGVFGGALAAVEDGYDAHPCMLPLVQLLERAAALTDQGEVRKGKGYVGAWTWRGGRDGERDNQVGWGWVLWGGTKICWERRQFWAIRARWRGRGLLPRVGTAV